MLINRILDIFPPHQQSRVRAQLSFVLEVVLCQALIPTLDGKGRVLTLRDRGSKPGIRNLIREDKIHQIYSQIEVGQATSSMTTMNQSLVSLCRRGLISWEAALARSSPPDEFMQLMAGSPRAPQGH